MFVSNVKYSENVSQIRDDVDKKLDKKDIKENKKLENVLSLIKDK